MTHSGVGGGPRQPGRPVDHCGPEPFVRLEGGPPTEMDDRLDTLDGALHRRRREQVPVHGLDVEVGQEGCPGEPPHHDAGAMPGPGQLPDDLEADEAGGTGDQDHRGVRSTSSASRARRRIRRRWPYPEIGATMGSISRLPGPVRRAANRRRLPLATASTRFS